MIILSTSFFFSLLLCVHVCYMCYRPLQCIYHELCASLSLHLLYIELLIFWTILISHTKAGGRGRGGWREGVKGS